MDQDSNHVDEKIHPAGLEAAGEGHPHVPANHLPVPVSTPSPKAPRRRWGVVGLVLVILAAGGGGGFYWWKHLQSQLPPGISFGNGRIEADEIDISTKFAGRIAELLADIGDMVTPGQVVARMDTRDLQQSLDKAEAQGAQARRAIEEARANVAQQQAQQTLARQEMERAQSLLQGGWVTQQTVDQRQQQLDGANAALQAAEAKVAQAQHALEAAEHDAELYRVNIADNTLVAPRLGRIQYRIANIGEVLPAGGKVFTMLDVSYVYMDIYLPTTEAGKVKIGTDARIVLDALPTLAIPAKVSFVASEAQFTPKTVETQSERDKLMFRIRVRIDPERLKAYAEAVRSGLPGVAYVRWDPQIAWPEKLQGVP